MPNSTESKQQRRVDVLNDRRGVVDILPWQEELIGAYIPQGSCIHQLFRLKDGDIDCGLEIVYCHGDGNELNKEFYLN